MPRVALSAELGHLMLEQSSIRISVIKGTTPERLELIHRATRLGVVRFKKHELLRRETSSIDAETREVLVERERGANKSLL